MKEADIKKLITEYKEDESYISELYSKWDSFLQDFSLEQLKNICVYQYVVGKGDSTFCHRIEWTLKELGSIRGSNALKYGIYYGKTKRDSTLKYRSTKIFGGHGEDDFGNVKEELIRIIQFAQSINLFKDIDSKFSNLFKYKVMFVYNRDSMIPIFNKDHLDFYIKFFEIKCKNSFEAEQNALIEFKKKCAPRGWDNRKFMAFLYDTIWPLRFADFFYDKFEKDNDFDLKVSTDLSSSKKPSKQKESNGIYFYPRDKKEASKAYIRSGMKCEIDNNHESFISAKTGKRYLECHHLIPMSRQGEEKFKHISIDVAQNIVCLCSDCHNRIHYGKDKKELISKLYHSRIKQLEEYGVSIMLDELVKYYR